jgi:hypothetical protein
MVIRRRKRDLSLRTLLSLVLARPPVTNKSQK